MIGANDKCVYFRDMPKPVRDLVGLIKLVSFSDNVQFRYNDLVMVYNTTSLDLSDWTFEIYAIKIEDLKDGIETVEEEDKLLVYGVFKGRNGFLPECTWKIDGPWKDDYFEMIRVIDIRLREYQKELDRIAESQRLKEEGDLIDKVRVFTEYFNEH